MQYYRKDDSMKPIFRMALLICAICSISFTALAMPQTNAASWAVDSITRAYDAGLVPDNLLGQATSEITRKDFAALAVKFYTQVTKKAATPKNPTPFKDVDSPDITFAFENGIISGRTATEFYPNQSLTREQMAIIITRALTASGDTLENPIVPAPFADTANLPKVSQDAVTQLYYLNITTGADGYYYPEKAVTVQEAILAFFNAYEYLTGKMADMPLEETPEESPQSNIDTAATPTPPQPSVPTADTAEVHYEEWYEAEVTIGNKTLAMGQSQRTILQTAGIPDRIDQDSYGYERYVYLNGYADLFFVTFDDGKVIEIYTGSDHFEYLGIKGNQNKKDVKNIKFHDMRNFRLELPTTSLDSYLLLDHEEGIEGLLLRDLKFRDLIDRRYNKSFEAGAVQELMDLINQARVRQGQTPLTPDATAAEIATKHCFNMVKNSFVEYNDHTGKTPFDRMTEGGLQFKMAAELAGKYQGDAISIYHEWMRNIGTRSNVLNGSLSHAGIGIYMDNYTIYATADLFKP